MHPRLQAFALEGVVKEAEGALHLHSTSALQQRVEGGVARTDRDVATVEASEPPLGLGPGLHVRHQLAQGREVAEEVSAGLLATLD